MTEEDIDRRVEENLEKWASQQRRPAGVSRSKGQEERAAARVKSVNAGMYFNSPM
jgi:hypothetical protein